jgi:hypothetical protein
MTDATRYNFFTKLTVVLSLFCTISIVLIRYFVSAAGLGSGGAFDYMGPLYQELNLVVIACGIAAIVLAVRRRKTKDLYSNISEAAVIFTSLSLTIAIHGIIAQFGSWIPDYLYSLCNWLDPLRLLAIIFSLCAIVSSGVAISAILSSLSTSARRGSFLIVFLLLLLNATILVLITPNEVSNSLGTRPHCDPFVGQPNLIQVDY